MTPHDIDRVQSSFAKVAPNSQAAAELFYGRLFEIAPQVKPMFKGDINEQGKKLMMTLGVVVNGLKDLSSIVPVAQQLAIKHVDYGVEAGHYDLVGEALIWTLGKGLGEDFTDETKQAWVNAYSTLSSVMIEAAYPNTQAAE